jgi:hypothetical protein
MKREHPGLPGICVRLSVALCGNISKKNLLAATQIAALKKRFERCKTQILALD